MTKMMRAIWVEQPGGLEVLEDRELPLPEPGQGEVRVRVKAVGLNPVDAAWRRGEHLPPLPGVLGRDFSGVVDALGPGVVPRNCLGCDLDVGVPVLGYAGRASNGTYAEYLCLPVELVGRLRPSLGFERAASLPVAILTADRLLTKLRTPLADDEAVLVTGASGAVGTLVTLVLVREGRPVMATTSSDAGAEHLVRLGVKPDHIIRVDRGGPERWLAQVEDVEGGTHAAVDLAGGRLKHFCLEALLGMHGELFTIVEEPEELARMLWDERTSPVLRKSLGVFFVQLSSGLLFDDRSLWESFYGHRLHVLADGAAMNGIDPFFETLTVLGPLSAETARKGHALLDARAARGKLVITVP